MISNSPVTHKEQWSCLTFLGMIPAIYIGLQLGFFATQIGARDHVTDLLVRIVLCSLPAITLAAIFPRLYFAITVVYLCSFSYGYYAATNLFRVPHFPAELLFIVFFALYGAISVSWILSRHIKPAEQGAAANP